MAWILALCLFYAVSAEEDASKILCVDIQFVLLITWRSIFLTGCFQHLFELLRCGGGLEIDFANIFFWLCEAQFSLYSVVVILLNFWDFFFWEKVSLGNIRNSCFPSSEDWEIDARVRFLYLFFVFSTRSNWDFWDRNDFTFSTYHEKCISIIEVDRKIG